MSCESAFKNEAVHKPMITENLEVVKSVRHTVFCEDIFWVHLQNSLKILQPIVSAITLSETDKPLLADIPQLTAKTKSTVFDSLHAFVLTNQEVVKVKGFLCRREKFCCKPIHAAANLLD